MTANHINEATAVALVNASFDTPGLRRESAGEYVERKQQERIDALATTYFNANRDSVLMGCEDGEVNRDTKDAGNSLLENLAESGDLPTLVRTAFSCSAEVTGRAFVEILVRVMKADAERDAEIEIKGQRAMLND
jgi:hypothetical protein